MHVFLSVCVILDKHGPQHTNTPQRLPSILLTLIPFSCHHILLQISGRRPCSTKGFTDTCNLRGWSGTQNSEIPLSTRSLKSTQKPRILVIPCTKNSRGYTHCQNHNRGSLLVQRTCQSLEPQDTQSRRRVESETKGHSTLFQKDELKNQHLKLWLTQT